MKLLCLCKRHPQGRDLFNRPYGRFFHLPRLLAERGHEVHLLLLSYRNDPSAKRRDGDCIGIPYRHGLGDPSLTSVWHAS